MQQSTEYVSNDILNDDLVKIFSPFHRLQTLLGVCRVDVKHKFVNPPTVLQKLYTCVIVTIVPIFLVVMIHFDLIMYGNVEHFPQIIVSMIFLQWIIFMCNIVNLRFLNSEGNMNLFLKMHKIDRIMKIDRNKFITSIMYKNNRNTVYVLMAIFTALYIILAIFDEIVMVIPTFGICYIQLTYMLEFLHFSSIMYYFCLRIRFLNAIIMNHLKPEFIPINFASKSMPMKKLMRRLAADTHDFAYSDIDTYLKELMNCFYKFKNINQYQILIFFTKLLFSCVFYMQFIIVSLKDNSLRLIDTYLMIFLSVVDAFLISLACVRCETFFREAKLTRCLSVAVMSMYYDGGPLREKAKRMLRYLEEHPPILSVYEMWELKGDTIVQLTGVLTMVFFNILQFNYL